MNDADVAVIVPPTFKLPVIDCVPPIEPVVINPFLFIEPVTPSSAVSLLFCVKSVLAMLCDNAVSDEVVA